MRMLLSTYRSRWNDPLFEALVRMRELGANVRGCMPRDFAERLPEVRVQLLRAGLPARKWAIETTPPSAAYLPGLAGALLGAGADRQLHTRLPRATQPLAAELSARAADLVATRFDTIATAASGGWR